VYKVESGAPIRRPWFGDIFYLIARVLWGNLGKVCCFDVRPSVIVLGVVWGDRGLKVTDPQTLSNQLRHGLV
jgi:hypothetical protein